MGEQKRQYNLLSYVKKSITYWRVRTGTNDNGSPRYFQRRDKEEVEKEVGRLRELQKNNDLLGQEARNIVYDKRHEIVACIEELKSIGATVKDATNFYLKFHGAIGKVTAVKAFQRFF